MRLVVDLRRAFDSGLGTYIRHVVPATLAQLPGVHTTGLIAPGTQEQHRQYFGQTSVSWAPMTATPLSLAEQWALRDACASPSVFWATTLSHALFAKQRLVATVHDVAQLAESSAAMFSPAVRVASRLYFESLRQRAMLLLFNSQFTAHEFARYVGTSHATCVVTPLGVDSARWQGDGDTTADLARAKTAGAPYFLWLGNLRPHKNLPTLIAALALTAQVLPHHLLVVGRASAGGAPELSIPPLPSALLGRVHILGEVAGNALPALMRGAQALVLPSLYEGFGLTVLEAFAANCLVVASRSGALPEVGGDAAFYFDAKDPQALADQLLAVVRLSSGERALRIASGLKRAHALPWQLTAKLTADALRKTLGSEGPHL
jgi:glycosyltransferase involved in cell wall biosynthesis